MKTCSSCKTTKPFSDFSRFSGSKDGFGAYCRPCAKIKRKEYYEANKEKERAQNRQWHLDHKPWLSQEKRDYINTWRRTHDRQTEKNNRRALEMNAEGCFSDAEWYNVCETYGNKCLACGRPDVKLTQDHVIPLSRGGSNWITNIQPLCGPCNSSKGVRVIDYREQHENNGGWRCTWAGQEHYSKD